MVHGARKGCSINTCTSSTLLSNYQGMSFAFRSFISLDIGHDISLPCMVVSFEVKNRLWRKGTLKKIHRNATRPSLGRNLWHSKSP